MLNLEFQALLSVIQAQEQKCVALTIYDTKHSCF